MPCSSATLVHCSSQQVSGRSASPGAKRVAWAMSQSRTKSEIDLAGEHGLEVELEEGLAREGLVVAQDAQAQAVGDDGPEVAGAAVEELLHQAVGIGGGGPAHAGGAAVEAQAAADQVDGHRAEEAVDGVGAAVDLGAGAGRRAGRSPARAAAAGSTCRW